MGLSASQARYLQLTARRSDNEYKAQQINNSRTEIAKKMQDISTKYTEGINNRMLNFRVPSSGDGTQTTSTRLTYNTITAQYPEGLGYKLVDKNGTEVRPSEKNARALREEAELEHKEALASKSFVVTAKDENGQDKKVEIDGSNFHKFLGQHDTVMNKNGDIIDSETFQSNINGMNASQFNKYWNSMEFSFVSGSKMNEEKSAASIENAEKNYQAKLKEADELDNKACVYDDRCLKSEYLEEQLRNGEWTLQKMSDSNFDDNGDAVWENIHYSAVGLISDELYTDDDSSATNEYNTQMDYFQHKDKQLELELQQLETTHNAIQTEIDSVKKVIEKNVEKSFKTFG